MFLGVQYHSTVQYFQCVQQVLYHTGLKVPITYIVHTFTSSQVTLN